MSAIIKEIEKISGSKPIKIMHVCGTHEMTIAKQGLRKILPKNIKVICGPGCPVCITPAQEIDIAIQLAFKGDNILTTFGDIVRVLGSELSLDEASKRGGDIRVVYGINEAIEIAKKTKKQVIHFAIGFETTTPTTAVEILSNPQLNNFSIIPSHRLVPPAMAGLLKSKDSQIDGFICPGHVSTVIGSKPYEFIAKEFNKPCVIGGFETDDVLLSILMVLKQIKNKEAKVEIQYTRSVKPEGNPLAVKKMWEVFDVCDSSWRGIGIIPDTGLKLRPRFKKFDALKKFNLKLKKGFKEKPGCKCGEIMKGLAEPIDCPFFKKQCKPESPVGACMVSMEGPCFITYKYESF